MKKLILQLICQPLLVMSALVCAFSFQSCNEEDDDYVSNPYVEIWRNNDTTLRLERLDLSTFQKRVPKKGMQNIQPSVKGQSNAYILRTNMNEWRIVPTAGYEEYVGIFPEKGSGDGRFAFDVRENPTIDSQMFCVNIVDKKGIVRASINVWEEASDPILKLDYTDSRVSAKGETISLGVTANTTWEAISDCDWLQVGERTAVSLTQSLQAIVIAPNGGGDRDGTIKFTLTRDASLSRYDVVLKIKQFAPTNSVGDATKISIQKLITDYSTSAGTPTTIDGLPRGVVTDNVYIEGYVISDHSKQALNKGQLVVEDESGFGLWIELADVKNGKNFNLNDKVRIHMYRATFIADYFSEGLKVYPMVSTLIENLGPSDGITPREITNLEDLQDPNFENTLVTLKNVEFALPRGTYVNITDEAIKYAQENPMKPAANWTTDARPHSDDALEYGHILRDPQGNSIKLYTSGAFLDRFKSTVPLGAGPLTGIVMRHRPKNGKDNYIIRLRSDEDNKVSTNKNTAFSKVIIQIGLWYMVQEESSPGITSTVGNATLTYTGRPQVNVEAGSSPNAFYWANSYARLAPCEVEDDGSLVGNVMVPYLADICYRDVNTQYWWKNLASSISLVPGSVGGEAWVITANLQPATVSGGDLFLAFSSSSSTSGPRTFRVEWSATNTNAVPETDYWNEIGNYDVCDVNNSGHSMEYMFKLPAGMKGLNQVYIRLRVMDNKRTGSNASIGNSGTNRIGMVRITQLK